MKLSLKQLSENEKKVVLNLFYIGANIDNDFSDEEKELFNSYMKEMNLQESELNKKLKLIDIVNDISRLSPENQKLVFTYFLKLVFIDNKYVKEEKEIVQELQKIFSLNDIFLSDTIKSIHNEKK